MGEKRPSSSSEDVYGLRLRTPSKTVATNGDMSSFDAGDSTLATDNNAIDQMVQSTGELQSVIGDLIKQLEASRSSASSDKTCQTLVSTIVQAIKGTIGLIRIYSKLAQGGSLDSECVNGVVRASGRLNRRVDRSLTKIVLATLPIAGDSSKIAPNFAGLDNKHPTPTLRQGSPRQSPILANEDMSTKKPKVRNDEKKRSTVAFLDADADVVGDLSPDDDDEPSIDNRKISAASSKTISPSKEKGSPATALSSSTATADESVDHDFQGYIIIPAKKLAPRNDQYLTTSDQLSHLRWQPLPEGMRNFGMSPIQMDVCFVAADRKHLMLSPTALRIDAKAKGLQFYGGAVDGTTIETLKTAGDDAKFYSRPQQQQQLCVTKYPDGSFYRAKLLGFKGEFQAAPPRFTVQYIDYGNLGEVGGADVFKMPASLANVPVMALAALVAPSIKNSTIIQREGAVVWIKYGFRGPPSLTSDDVVHVRIWDTWQQCNADNWVYWTTPGAEKVWGGFGSDNDEGGGIYYCGFNKSSLLEFKIRI